MVIGRLRAAWISAQREPNSAPFPPGSNNSIRGRQRVGATILPLREQLVGDVPPGAASFAGVVAFVLLIACANVANLVLGKSLREKKKSPFARRWEPAASQSCARYWRRRCCSPSLAVRWAASRALCTTLIVKFLADRLPRSTETTLDGPVLAFTAFLALFAGILAGILPRCGSREQM